MICQEIESTDEVLLVAKKYFWHKKLKLEIDNDGIYINQYLYSNIRYTLDTLEEIIHNFYIAQMLLCSTYEKK